MRTLSFIFVLIFAASISAQSVAVKQAFGEGTRLAKNGEFEKALASYRTALAASKDDAIDLKFLARLHYNLGVCEYRLGRAEKAIDELRIAIESKGGEYPEAFYALGMAETERENWAKAREAFIGALKTNERNGEAWFDLAFAYLGEKDLERAETAFRNAIANKSIDTPLSHNNVGVILAIRGDIDAAKTEFKAAVRTSGGRLKMAEDNLKFCETRASSVGISKKELIVAERVQ
ncbi:MAG: tetratricopeptide repeat protein [Pyrinomonadaceae bacterium]